MQPQKIRKPKHKAIMERRLVTAPAMPPPLVGQMPMVEVSAPSNACLIYILGDVDGHGAGRLVKFGKTRNTMSVRQKQHETRGPSRVEMRFLAGMWGHDSDEGALINWARKLGIVVQHTNEWVDADPRTPSGRKFRDWLRWLMKQHYVCTDIDLITQYVFVDSRMWLPNSRNHEPYRQAELDFNPEPFADLTPDDVRDGDYYTHPAITAAARVTMGGIDLDPSSCREANRAVQAANYFGVRDDGLQLEWRGRVWLNPPFGCWEMWAPKALAELKSNRVTEMCVYLTPNAATNKSAIELVQLCDALFVSAGRYSCWGPKSTSATEGTIVLYFGPNRDRFAMAFSELGAVKVDPR